MQLPRCALNDGLKHRLQHGTRDGLLDPAAQAPTGDEVQVGLRSLYAAVPSEAVGTAVGVGSGDLDRLQPALALRAQPEGDAKGAQAVIRGVEVDRAQRPAHGLADGQVAKGWMGTHPLQFLTRELELELQLTFPRNAHRQSPEAATRCGNGR